jgi:hypothetical protein
MTAAEIDEGAVEKAYRAYMDFVTDATTNDRGWTFRQAVRAMLLAALPAPASGGADPADVWFEAIQAYRAETGRNSIPIGQWVVAWMMSRPSPAPRQEITEVQRLRSLLEYRDEFIVSQGLWQTFVDGLPRAALGVAGQEPKGGR